MKRHFYKYFLPLFMITAGVIAFLHLSGDKSYSQVTYPVTVQTIRFLYGTGRGPTQPAPDTISDYYRGYGLPGTIIEITAQMTVGTNPAPMYGNIVFNVQYTDGTNTGNFNVTVPSGKNIGTGVIPYNDATGFLDAWIPLPSVLPSTAQFAYTVTGVTGDYAGALTGSPTTAIYWDRQDPPPAPLITGVNPSTTYFTLYWTPIYTALSTSTNRDRDFYEYRVHYREEGESAYRVWDGSNDSTLRGLENNVTPPGGTDQKIHFLNGNKYTIVYGLKLFTKYEYILSAVDVFGNESDISGTPRLLTTLPYSILVTISDGIDSYNDFSDLNAPQNRTLRESNIKVDLNVVVSAGGSTPDTIRIWFANYSDNTNIVNTADNSINRTAFAGNALYSTDAIKKTQNNWVAFLSTQTAVIKNNNSVRFIIETVTGDVSAYSDFDMSDSNPNDDEYTFHVGTGANFKPWPVRVLNNVITKKDPVAYPSYYLTNDAYVTIRIFDIKGRPVVVLMDGVFRRGGQNIKEDGWRGTNKAKKKLGVGLYYMHFNAKRAGDGKIILNEFSKVVMAY